MIMSDATLGRLTHGGRCPPHPPEYLDPKEEVGLV